MKTHILAQWAKYCGACLLALALRNSGRLYAQQFEISGTVGFTQFKPDTGEKISYTTADFRISVRDGNWFVRIKVNAEGAYDYQEASYDSTNLYYVGSMEQILKNKRAEGIAVGQNIATGWIYKRPILHTTFAHEVGIIWLAYASAYYFQALTNDMAEPVISIGVSSGVYNEQHDYKQRVEWSTFEGKLNLPRKAVYFEDGVRRPLQPLLSRTKTELHYPSPYDRGYTNAIFRVLQTTNLEGFTVPVVAELETFVPLSGGRKATDLAKINHYYLIGTNFAPRGAMAGMQPKLPGVTAVSDARFLEKAGVFSYLRETGWLSEREAMETPSFRRNADTTRYLRNYTRPRHPFAILTAFLFLFGLPLLYFAFRNKPETRTEQKGRECPQRS
jgi:hypothetical protein